MEKEDEKTEWSWMVVSMDHVLRQSLLYLAVPL